MSSATIPPLDVQNEILHGTLDPEYGTYVDTAIHAGSFVSSDPAAETLEDNLGDGTIRPPPFCLF